MCWCPFGGLIGLHHYYLCFGLYHFHPARLLLAILYTCTLGLFGIGWLVDGFRLKVIVSQINKEIKEKKELREEEEIVSLARHLEDQERLREIGINNLQLREEQDLEFVTALSKDQHREMQNVEVGKEEEEIELKRKEKTEKDNNLLIKQKLLEFPLEPDTSEDIVNLVFRMPNGERIQRRFHKNDKLHLVRDWLDLQKKSLGITPNNEFSIETDFPRKVYSEYDTNLGDLFPRNQMLVVVDKKE